MNEEKGTARRKTLGRRKKKGEVHMDYDKWQEINDREIPYEEKNFDLPSKSTREPTSRQKNENLKVPLK